MSQSPLDLPETVLGQLGNRVQHALRAFTPKDQKAVKIAAATLRKNPALDTENIITILGVGEALVSFLDEEGTPCIVEKVKIYPPASRIGPMNDQECTELVNGSPFKGVYEKTLDRESAYEKIKAKMDPVEAPKLKQPEPPPPKSSPAPKGRPRQTASEAMITSAARSIGSSVGRQIVRGLLGTIFGKSR